MSEEQEIKILEIKINESDPDVYLIDIKLEINSDIYWNMIMEYINSAEVSTFHINSNIFTFSENIDNCLITTDILNSLKELQNGNNFGTATIEDNIIRCLRALDLFWN
jgi:hypothetical protein